MLLGEKKKAFYLQVVSLCPLEKLPLFAMNNRMNLPRTTSTWVYNLRISPNACQHHMEILCVPPCRPRSDSGTKPQHLLPAEVGAGALHQPPPCPHTASLVAFGHGNPACPGHAGSVTSRCQGEGPPPTPNKCN